MSGCRSAVDEVAIQYVREIAVVLRTRDLERVKKFYHRWQDAMELGPIPDDAQLEVDMHKMILELPALEDLHESSSAWLLERGHVWNIRENNCSSGCSPNACGRGETEGATAMRMKGDPDAS